MPVAQPQIMLGARTHKLRKTAAVPGACTLAVFPHGSVAVYIAKGVVQASAKKKGAG